MEESENTKIVSRRGAVKALAVAAGAALMLAGCTNGGNGADSAVSASSTGQSSALSAGSASASEAGKAKSKADYELEFVDAKVFRETKRSPSSDPVDLLLLTFDMKNVSECDQSSSRPRYSINAYQNGVKLKESLDYESAGLTEEEIFGVSFAPGYSQKAYALYELREESAPVEIKSDGNSTSVSFEKTVNIA